MAECYFKLMGSCSEPKSQVLTNAGRDRIQSIINASIKRGDTLPTDLEFNIRENSDFTVQCHRSCVSSYTSKHKIGRALQKQQKSPSEQPPAKRTRRSQSQSEFTFQTHCIFCGEKCAEQKDYRNPGRWRPVSRCRTIGSTDKNFKETILQVCRDRNDQWAKDVELRVLGAVSDLHAADARYHRDCRPSFMGPKSLKTESKPQKDPAFSRLVTYMESDMSKLWASTEVHKQYTDDGGIQLQRRNLVDALGKHFGERLLLLSCKGLATLLVFRSRASELVHLEDDSDDNEHAIKTVASLIVQEAKTIDLDSKSFCTRINEQIALTESGSTLMSLLSEISPKLSGSLPALLIGNMITGAVKHRPTSLQVALGVYAREKHLINTLHDFSVTCSYDEVLRFKSSAAHNTADLTKVQGIFKAEDGLIQTVIDNYDANISSLSGLKSTHALAMLMCQSQADPATNEEDEEHRIPRVSKANMKLPDDETNIHHYNGLKHPGMLDVPPLTPEAQGRLQVWHNISLKRAQELDLQFLKSVTSNDNVAEYGGHITKVAREQNHTVRPATTTRYRPLIDLRPSDPSTIKTALVEAQALTSDCGQNFVIITADQQLYKVILDNIWSSPELFGNIYPRLGGFHTVMSFCGCVGKLMMDSGLPDILKTTFGGVEKMLSGKKYPQNVRAFRLLAEEILRKYIKEIDSFEDLETWMADLSTKSKTAKLWLDGFIRPVLIIMAFTRAERESDWPLHLWALSQMLPYFFAAGHVNYARYGMYYLRSMEALPPEITEKFLRGQHTMRHTAGASNATWSDMYIESTFMRFGHSHGGLTGLTMNSNATKRWSLSLHSCSRLAHDIQAMRDNIQQPSVYHKEESRAQIRSDAHDRQSLQKKLEHCIDPLDPTGHPKELFNIATGELASSTVNVDEALALGKQSAEAYEAKLPDGFHETISCPVTTMATKRKKTTLHGRSDPTFDTEVIFTRTIGLMDTEDFNLRELFDYELSQIPTSLFTDEGNLRPATSKSKLKNSLGVERSSRMTPNPEVVVLDGCAILWTIHWPVPGRIIDLIAAVETYLRQKLVQSDVYLVFDRYHAYSPKGCTRSRRSSITESSPFHLTLNSPLPSQAASLSIVDNKVQIINLLCDALVDRFQTDRTDKELVITGPDPVPYSIQKGMCLRRTDLKVTHEEADVIIVNHVVDVARGTQKTIHIICDDTDVFVLLVHFVASEGLCNNIFLVPTRPSRNAIDIGATANQHAEIAKYLLPLHALTGCDTVSTLYGIGKVKALKVLKHGHHPPLLGDSETDEKDLEKQAVAFIAKCYGSKATGSMSEVRYSMWQHKTAKSKSRKFKLATLPPSSRAFALHIKRAQYQASLWKAALQSDPPALAASDFGWKPDHDSQTLLPIPLPPDTMAAPDRVLNLLCCSCHSSTDVCSTRRCLCRKNDIACSTFCNCSVDSSLNCCNPLNKALQDAALDDTDDEDDDTESENEDSLP